MVDEADARLAVCDQLRPSLMHIFSAVVMPDVRVIFREIVRVPSCTWAEAGVRAGTEFVEHRPLAVLDEGRKHARKDLVGEFGWEMDQLQMDRRTAGANEESVLLCSKTDEREEVEKRSERLPRLAACSRASEEVSQYGIRSNR